MAVKRPRQINNLPPVAKHAVAFARVVLAHKTAKLLIISAILLNIVPKLKILQQFFAIPPSQDAFILSVILALAAAGFSVPDIIKFLKGDWP